MVCPPPTHSVCHPIPQFPHYLPLVLPQLLSGLRSHLRNPRGLWEGSCLPRRPGCEACDCKRAYRPVRPPGPGSAGRNAETEPFSRSGHLEAGGLRMRLLFTSHQGSTAKTKRIRGKQRADKSPQSTSPRLQLYEQPKTHSFQPVRVGFPVTCTNSNL